MSLYIKIAIAAYIIVSSMALYQDKVQIDSFNRELPNYIAQANACIHAEENLMMLQNK